MAAGSWEFSLQQKHGTPGNTGNLKIIVQATSEYEAIKQIKAQYPNHFIAGGPHKVN